ncbi:MAG: phenylalanyl-tRNA synthetase alpha chain, partial [Ilumatobacteraceae bacterium]
MIEEVKRAGEAALARVAGASTADEVRSLEAELLGKRGPFATFKSGLAALATVEEKRTAGQAVNEATSAVAESLAQRRGQLIAAERTVQLDAERIDLTEVMTRPRRGHAHVVTQAWERLEDVFIGLGFQVAEGPDVETDWYNFEALNLPPDHPARSMHDTFYVEHGEPGSTVLRTHTSPVQIRVMQTVPPPIYMIMPGRVFRNETADATHLAVFHQLEGLVIDRGITLADLAGTIESFTKAYFGADFGSRLRPSYFPFTEPSAEFDIQTPSG